MLLLLLLLPLLLRLLLRRATSNNNMVFAAAPPGSTCNESGDQGFDTHPSQARPCAPAAIAIAVMQDLLLGKTLQPDYFTDTTILFRRAGNARPETPTINPDRKPRPETPTGNPRPETPNGSPDRKARLAEPGFAYSCWPAVASFSL